MNGRESQTDAALDLIVRLFFAWSGPLLLIVGAVVGVVLLCYRFLHRHPMPSLRGFNAPYPTVRHMGRGEEQ